MNDHRSDQIRVVCAAIDDGHRYLITQRSASASFPLMWEFPGGRVRPDESDQDALARTLAARLGVTIRVEARLSTTERFYPSMAVQLALYRCTLGATSPVARGVRAFAWVTSADFDDYPFVPADHTAMRMLLPR